MKYVLLSALCVLSLSACNATYRDGGSHVHVNDGYYGNGGFCPPGQAKKGNC
jgi:hypothetical protein